MGELKRTLVHLPTDQLEQLDELVTVDTSRAAHIRQAIKQYLERARRRERRASASA